MSSLFRPYIPHSSLVQKYMYGTFKFNITDQINDFFFCILTKLNKNPNFSHLKIQFAILPRKFYPIQTNVFTSNLHSFEVLFISTATINDYKNRNNLSNFDCTFWITF